MSGAFSEGVVGVYRLIRTNANKGLRLIAAIGLTALAALNTYQFLAKYNEPIAAIAAALSFELMYIAASWNLVLKGRWKVLANDAVVIVTGVVCSTVYNVLNHVSEEVTNAFAGDAWAVALSFVMSLLLTIPACLLLVSIHNNNHVAEVAIQETSRIDSLEARLNRLTESIEIIRKHLGV